VVLEKQMFDWEEYDTVDTMVLQFYNAVLKQDIGNYTRGTTIECIVFDVEHAKMRFFTNDGTLLDEFDLSISISIGKQHDEF
jgi:hypothetical protein